MDAKTIMHTDEPSPELLAWPSCIDLRGLPVKQPPAKQPPTPSLEAIPTKAIPTHLPLGLMNKAAPTKACPRCGGLPTGPVLAKPPPAIPPILAATPGKSPPPSRNMALHVHNLAQTIIATTLPEVEQGPTRMVVHQRMSPEQAPPTPGSARPPHPSLEACLAEMSVMSADEIDRRVADLSPFSEETESEG